MFESQVAKFLSGALPKDWLATPLRPEQLQIDFWACRVVIRDVVLGSRAICTALGLDPLLPVTIEALRIDRIELVFPLFSLLETPIEIHLDGVNAVVHTCDVVHSRQELDVDLDMRRIAYLPEPYVYPVPPDVMAAVNQQVTPLWLRIVHEQPESVANEACCFGN